MKARTIAVVTLGLVFLALVLWRRRPETRPVASARPEEDPPKPLARSEVRSAARSLAGGGALLRISLALGAIALTSLGIWRLSIAFGPDEGGEARAALVEVTATLAPPTPPPPTSVPTPPQTWRLLAGGDVLMDLTEAAGIDPFAGLVPSLSGAELAAVNVEMSIATGGSPEVKSFVFRAPPSAAATMAAAGIDIGSLGNNHALDYGLDALFETAANLQNAGVAPVGSGNSALEAYAPRRFDVNGLRVGVIGASRVLPYVRWAAAEGPGIASAYYEDTLLQAVRSAKATHDVVIVMIHWGVEGAPCPNEDQTRLGRGLLEAGASVVLGSHPHVLQPVVQRDGGLIAYSLGNFVWRPRSGPNGETGVLEIAFDGARVTGFSFHPHVLDGQGLPVPADAESAARIQASVSAPCG